MNHFAGAFGAVRNLLDNTEAEFSDSVEAEEYLLLADLLMRQLNLSSASLPTGCPPIKKERSERQARPNLAR